MCHQSVGLIAREVEARGIPTLSMSSAYSITRAVNPPRAVYLDYPLGHTSGKPLDQHNQLAIMRDTLAAFAAINSPGEIHHLAYEWQTDHSWKDRVMRPRGKVASQAREDNRVERFDSPQYQHPNDELAADLDCPTCVFLTDFR